jgi:hypothetical protein
MRARASCAALAVLLGFVAGPAWAGDTWRAEYEVREGEARRTLVVVRSDDRVEYRAGVDAPVRIWRRLDDGIERLEVFAGRGAAVLASPGDLRTFEAAPDWETLAGIVPASLRASLEPRGHARRFERDASRHSGRDPDGHRVALEWLDEVGLPADYRAGDYRLHLRSLERVDEAQAFTPVADLRVYDRADLGDMPLDPFARDYLDRFGSRAHAH